MCILAIDTSDSITHVAIKNQQGDVICNSGIINQQASHNEELASLVLATLAQANCDFANLKLLIIGSGPGSFTGLRIGYGFIKGLAVGLKIPLIQQCSFDAAFFEFYGAGEGLKDYHNANVISDARRNQCFWKSFKTNSGILEFNTTVKIVEFDVSQVQAKTALITFPNLLGIEKFDKIDPKDCFSSKNLSLGHLHLHNYNLNFASHDHISSLSGFDLRSLSQLSPNYVRPINAKTIAERSLSTE